MFTVVLITLCGILVGYLLRRFESLQHVNSTITITICLMLFILGVSVGENHDLVQNLWRFGGQALLISLVSLLGSSIAAWLVYRYFFNKEDKKQ